MNAFTWVLHLKYVSKIDFVFKLILLHQKFPCLINSYLLGSTKKQHDTKSIQHSLINNWCTYAILCYRERTRMHKDIYLFIQTSNKQCILFDQVNDYLHNRTVIIAHTPVERRWVDNTRKRCISQELLCCTITVHYETDLRSVLKLLNFFEFQLNWLTFRLYTIVRKSEYFAVKNHRRFNSTRRYNDITIVTNKIDRNKQQCVIKSAEKAKLCALYPRCGGQQSAHVLWKDSLVSGAFALKPGIFNFHAFPASDATACGRILLVKLDMSA